MDLLNAFYIAGYGGVHLLGTLALLRSRALLLVGNSAIDCFDGLPQLMARSLIMPSPPFSPIIIDGMQAFLTFVTALAQVLAAVLVVRQPKYYSKWRLTFYSFSTVWSMVITNLVGHHLHSNYCDPAGGALFWVCELVSTGLPWLALHSLIFPLPFTRALLVNAVSGIFFY